MQFTTLNASRALFSATLAFAANCSVWTLYAVTALEINNTLGLTATEMGLLLSAPMLTGALTRFPAGLLADRMSPKTLFIWQMLLVVPGLFLLPYAETLREYILIGLWIGISGASFTIGIRYITDWFDRSQQGRSMGIFGAGNAGVAVTLFVTPYIVDQWGWDNVGNAFGFGLLLTALLFYFIAPNDNPSLGLNQKLTIKQQLAPLKQIRVWRFGLYYYFVFGSFLALILWLPHYYHNAYNLTIEQAMVFTLFFATTSSMVRVLGGWFSDRYGGRTVNWSVFWVCLVCLFFLSYPPTTMIIHGVESQVEITIKINVWIFTALMFVVGIAQGFGRASVYKVIHDYYPNQMGSVGGFVGAIGAMGGCTLPIIFGVAVDFIGIYSVCFMILYGVLTLCMIVMFMGLKSDRYNKRLDEALSHNFLEDD
jgi:NNP family nitrate/nitrite transporter-like MFS transporter